MMILLQRNNRIVDISDYVTALTRSSDINQAPESLEISLEGIKLDVGDFLLDFQDDQEVFRGNVWVKNLDSSQNSGYTAYSLKKYLVKNTESYVFRNMTASQIFKKVCSDFKLPVGTVENTKIILPTLVLSNKLLYDVLTVALSETVKRGGQRFTISDKSGKLSLLERKKQYSMWVLEEGQNLIQATYTESLEDMANIVKVVGKQDKKEIIATVRNDSLIRLFGQMQHIEEASTTNNPELQEMADKLLKELGKVGREGKIKALDIPTIDAGHGIYVVESYTGLVGTYWVQAVSHDEVEGTMDITLQWTDQLPTLEYQRPSNNTEKEVDSTISDSLLDEILNG